MEVIILLGHICPPQFKYCTVVHLLLLQKQKSTSFTLAHHDGEEKMQYCDKEESNSCYQCNKSFSTKNNLQHRMLVHSGEKPHICQICNSPIHRAAI